jgi:hypothetical protein
VFQPAWTKSFKELVQGRVKTDKTFAEALLREGVDAMLSGDVETGKTILRDTIKATVGFEKPGEANDTPPKNLIRMFGPRGNPQAKNPFSVIGYLQKRAGVQLHVSGWSGRSPDGAQAKSGAGLSVGKSPAFRFAPCGLHLLGDHLTTPLPC